MSTQNTTVADSNASRYQRKTASIRKLIEAIKKRLTSFAPEKIPSDIQDRDLQPGGPLDTDWSLILSKEFEYGGYAGLARAIQQLAKETQDDARVIIKKNYNDVSGDTNHISMMITLATMNDSFLETILKGTLFHEVEKDPKFQRLAQGAHNLRKSPGNYIQAFVRRNLKRSSTQSQIERHGIFKSTAPHYGKSLTPRELVQLHDVARRYLPNDPNTDPSLARKIDSIYQPGVGPYDKQDYEDGHRKYCAKEGQEQKLSDWLDELKATRIDRIEAELASKPDNPMLDEPMTATPVEIGWGVDLQARANAHDNHASSNFLFTFYQALVRHVCDPDGIDYHVPRYRTHLIFDPKNAFDEAKLGDVFMTLLAQGEWIRAGMNPQPGGGGGVSKQSTMDRAPWIAESKNLLFADNSHFFKNLAKDDEKLKRLEYLQTTFNAPARKAAVAQRIQACLQQCYRVDVLEQIVQVKECEDVLKAFTRLKAA